MKVITPEISWHERDPIYTCAFHPIKTRKFATAGVTGIVRLWEVGDKIKETTSTSAIGSTTDIDVNFIANLKRHTKSVNVVRWSYDGTILASAGDEAVIFLWKENDIKNQKTLDMDEDENKENWFSFKCFRGHLEDILDISWSSDGNTLISGSVDNSIILWNVLTGDKTAILKEPKGFVQGVVYDPSGINFACLSTDRCLRIYTTNNNKCVHNVNKLQISKEPNEVIEIANKKMDKNTIFLLIIKQIPNVRMYHDDTMKSFFRRMCYSPDGNLLFTPAGCLDIDMKPINASFIYRKNSYNRPCLYLPHDKPSVAISVCPLKYELNQKKQLKDEIKVENLFKYVFAIATEDSIYLYDTQNLTPFAFVTGIHYSNLSDLSWSCDGKILNVTSIDGFCSFIIFNEHELGTIFKEQIMECDDKSSATSVNAAKLAETETVKKDFFNQTKKAKESNSDENVLSEVIVLETKTDNSNNTKKENENESAKKTLNAKRIKLIPLA